MRISCPFGRITCDWTILVTAYGQTGRQQMSMSEIRLPGLVRAVLVVLALGVTACRGGSPHASFPPTALSHPGAAL